MWIDTVPIQRDWNGGKIQIVETYYEFDGPVVFQARVGLNKLLFAKRDEGEYADFYLAVEADELTIDALRSGRLSLRGALNQRRAWLIETDLKEVFGFQGFVEGEYDALLPTAKAGLFSRYGVVPDTLEQADAFIAFRFVGPAVARGQVRLSILQEKINHFSNFIKKALVPRTLLNGRDYRFFDVEMAEPRFSSLLIAAKKPTFNEQKILQSRRIGNIDIEQLNQQANNQGNEFWSLLSDTIDIIDRNGELSEDFVINNQNFLENLSGLIPDEGEGLNRVEVTFNDGNHLKTVIIEDENRRKIVEAQKSIERLDTRTIMGVIVEVNGDAETFIIKDAADRQTTCLIRSSEFEELDNRNALYRGRQVSVTGTFTRRTRRDQIFIERPIVFLN